MIAGTIWEQLITTLERNPTLKDYIKKVFSGRRYDIEPETLPCLMLEPVRDGEISKKVNNVQDIYFTINLFGFCNNNFSNFDNTIVGNQVNKGILDINNDVRACLISSNTLGERVIDTIVETTEFDTLDEKYPVRGFVMPIRILYRQQEGV